jgi:hypothetical protein
MTIKESPGSCSMGCPPMNGNDVIDVIHRQGRRDLQRLRAQGDHPPSAEANTVISLPDTIKVPSLPATRPAA